MVKLAIMNFSRSCAYYEWHWINHSCIQMIRDGGTNLVGVKFVRMVFTPAIMKALPCSDRYGFIYVKGTVEEILNAISEAKGETE